MGVQNMNTLERTSQEKLLGGEVQGEPHLNSDLQGPSQESRPGVQFIPGRLDAHKKRSRDDVLQEPKP